MKTLHAISLDLGLTRNALYNARDRNRSFPRPVHEVGTMRFYDEVEVVRWHRKYGKVLA